jgi:hypothetical protein
MKTVVLLLGFLVLLCFAANEIVFFQPIAFATLSVECRFAWLKVEPRHRPPNWRNNLDTRSNTA